MKVDDLTAVILTHNEEEKIQGCIESLDFCREIIVIDDNSNDKTRKIASECSAKVYEHKLSGDFANQRNWALDKVQTKWTLFVDADEIVTKELAVEIVEQLKNCQDDGFYLTRQDLFLGKNLKYGDSGSFCAIRLGRTRSGVWKGQVHEIWDIKNAVKTLGNPLLHQPHDNVSKMVDTINFYSTLRANELWSEKITSHWYDILIFPGAKFCQNYIVRQGFRDGSRGMAHAILMSFYSYLVRSKLYLLNRKNPKYDK